MLQPTGEHPHLYHEEKSLLEERFELSRPIVGTQSLHSAIPISTNELVVRKYSTATSMMTVQVFVKKDDVIFDNIAGYVTCKYDSHWWLAYVLYPSHTSLRERRDASVTAKSSVAGASRRSRISIIAVVELSCYRPVTFPVTEASPKHHRKIKHVQFFPRPLGDCLVTERSLARRGHVV